MEITINNLNDSEKYNFNNFTIKKYTLGNKYDHIFGLIPLSKDNNILFREKSIFIYNDSFNEKKIIKEDCFISEYYKINENAFLYSDNERIYLIKKENNEFIEKKINVKIYDIYNISFCFLKKNENILFFYANLRKYKNPFIFVLNLNVPEPEIIQYIEISEKMKNLIKCHYSFLDDDSIYFTYEKHYPFYEIVYLMIYKMEKKELKLISKKEINRKKIKLNVKCFI